MPREYDIPICRECTQKHIQLKHAPACCSIGAVGLSRDEAARIGIDESRLEIEGGCQFWQADSGGCTVYDKRPGSCRFFPNHGSTIDFYDATKRYESCPLIGFLYELWLRKIESRAVINEPEAGLHNTPLFDSQELELVANLVHWADDSMAEADAILQGMKAKYEQSPQQEPLVTLFYVETEGRGGVFASPSQRLSKIITFKETNPVLAGLVYPSIESLPESWQL